MKVYRVSPRGYNPFYEKDAGAIIEWIEYLEIGDGLIITVKEMTEGEYKALPEYQGP